MTRQDKTRQDKTRQDKTRQDKTRQDKTRQDKTRQDKTRQDKTRQDKTRQDKTRQDKTRQDVSQAHHLLSVAQSIKVAFRFYCCTACFSVLLRRGRLELRGKHAYLWVAEKRITVVSHLFLFVIHFTDTDGTVTLTTLSSASPLLPCS